ncbi:uncharacterized protein [Argopecten irradians]|uniref:uncharacterized protein n=1 Tax=Argopecten irradians TaxID=31199 RepID=UPI0037180FBC
MASMQTNIRTKGSASCVEHRKKKVVIECKRCDMLICLTCSVTSHNGHDMVELSDVLPQKKRVLTHFIDEAEKNTLNEVQHDMENTDKKLADLADHYDDLIKNIEQQGISCKKIIENIVASFVSTCKDEKMECMSLLNCHKTKLQERYSTLIRLIEECKRVLQSGNNVEVYDEVIDVGRNSVKLESPVLKTTKFSPNNSSKDLLRTAIGMLCVESLSSAPEVLDRDLNESKATMKDDSIMLHHSSTQTTNPKERSRLQFKTSVSGSDTILSLCPTPSGDVWVLRSSSPRKVELFDANGFIKNSVVLDYTITSIGLSPVSSSLWLSCGQKNLIYRLATPSSEPLQKFRTRDSPTSICVRTKTIMVTSEQTITIYDSTGTILFEYHAQQPIRCAPTECPVTGHIAFVAETKAFGGMLSTGQYTISILHSTFAYMTSIDISLGLGNPLSASSRLSVVYDHSGNLVVLDKARRKIDLLDGNGKYLKTIQVLPDVIAVRGGSLWTAGPQGDLHTIDYEDAGDVEDNRVN